MDEKTVKAINGALNKGERVEVVKKPDGTVEVRTVQRKKLKIS